MTMRPEGISPVGAAVVLALLVSGGCYTDRTNTISRTARMRQIESERVVAERAQRELLILRQLTEDTNDSIDEARARSVATSSELRAVLVELQIQLDRLAAAEQDLAAARQRGAAITAELQPLRDLQTQLAERERRQQELAARLAALEPELAAAEKQFAEKQAEVAPKLAALQAQLAELAKVQAAIAAAESAAGGLVTPPAQPAAQPAGQPAKK